MVHAKIVKGGPRNDGQAPVPDKLLLERAKQLGIPEPSGVELRAGMRAGIQKMIAALVPITLEDLSEAGAEFERVEHVAASTATRLDWWKRALRSKAAS
jgi:hypothetical protein